MSESFVLWSTIVGFVLPPVLAVIMQARWRPEVKGLVTFLACLTAATGIAPTIERATDTLIDRTCTRLLHFPGDIYRHIWR